MFRQGAQWEAISGAAPLTGLRLNDVAQSYVHNVCVISLVMLTVTLCIVQVGIPEILYHTPSMTCEVMEAYKCALPSNILQYEIKHLTKKDGMYVIVVSFSQWGWFHGSKVHQQKPNFIH